LRPAARKGGKIGKIGKSGMSGKSASGRDRKQCARELCEGGLTGVTPLKSLGYRGRAQLACAST
jgi:hypothetical protein